MNRDYSSGATNGGSLHELGLQSYLRPQIGEGSKLVRLVKSSIIFPMVYNGEPSSLVVSRGWHCKAFYGGLSVVGLLGYSTESNISLG